MRAALVREIGASGAFDADPVWREAYGLWGREGRPQRERYGLTVDAEGDRAWLDDPGGPHVWPVPAA
ncbi:hypothetical protein ACH4FA_12180 [Streptomyces sp. NPDC017966]|uniref:hypothetical protein n=1 Tax=Streptomyces sp. NPDC017966 TaxID=3365023 RepID=UPI0037B693A5